MQAKAVVQSRRGAARPSMPKGILSRTVRYLLRYRGQAALPYLFLLVATISQLAVPRLVRNIIDAVTQGVVAQQVLAGLEKIPANFASQAFPRILEFLKYPETTTQAELVDRLTATLSGAPGLLIQAGFLIVAFSILRGIFAFLQSYWAERNSQAVSFDMRNDLYAKIQRLSFSYHDQTQTGQLMIRATDDVEKVRLFLGQGLVQLVGAIVLVAATLVILFSTNSQLALASSPSLAPWSSHCLPKCSRSCRPSTPSCRKTWPA